MAPAEHAHHPPFRPHRWIRGGHLQTVAISFFKTRIDFPATKRHEITLPDGDQIVLHDDTPGDWREGSPSLLIVHGLCGSHQTGYVVRLTHRFLRRGVRVFRLDMRGCGAGFGLAEGLNHAGRSGDLCAALEQIALITHEGPLWIVGSSLGGAQTLKMLGELYRDRPLSEEASESPQRSALQQRLQRVAVVAPPVDLLACSRNMQRFHLRLYNRYFIGQLLGRIPPRVRQSEGWQRIDLARRPRTMFELDHRVTAPLSGFDSALDYYTRCSALEGLSAIGVRTLVLAASDDPIVPIETLDHAPWSPVTTLERVTGGGHVAFLQRGPQPHWMDQRLEQWFC